MSKQKNAGVVEDLVDKINAFGDKVYDVAEKVPGIDWAAELGRMTLSDNKWIRAVQILGAATGGWTAPIGIVVLIKKALGDGPEAEKAQRKIQTMVEFAHKRLEEDKARALAAQKAQGQTPPAPQAAQPQLQPRAASFPVVKNTRLRARLIRVALNIKLMRAAERIARGQMKGPKQLQAGDVIEWRGKPMKILRTRGGGEASVEFQGKRMEMLLPNRLYTVLQSAPQKKNWFQLAAESRIAGDDLELIPLDEDEDEEAQGSEFEKGVEQGAGAAVGGGLMSGLMEGLGDMVGEGDDEDLEASSLRVYSLSDYWREAGLLEDIGSKIAPRTTQNIKEMVACEPDGDQEGCGDDGSYPAGPRSEAKKTRYHVEPAHGQSTVDLLRFTASMDDLSGRLFAVAEGPVERARRHKKSPHAYEKFVLVDPLTPKVLGTVKGADKAISRAKEIAKANTTLVQVVRGTRVIIIAGPDGGFSPDSPEVRDTPRTPLKTLHPEIRAQLEAS